MTSAPVSMSKPQTSHALMPPAAWVWVAVLGGLFVTLFRDWIIRMLRIATNARGSSYTEVIGSMFGQSWNPDWSHALVIPFISLYYIHLHRNELVASRADQRWRPLEHALQWTSLLVLALWGLLLTDLLPGRLAGVMAFALRGPLMPGSLVLTLLGPLLFAAMWRPILARAGLRVDASAWCRLLGLLILVIGIANYIYWIYPGRNDMLQGYSVVLSLFGMLLMVLGPARMKTLWFPVLFLVFAVKIADRQWEQIAWQLQWIASHAAGVVLNALGFITGVHVDVTGSTIEMYKGVTELGKLNVAEACAGLRMLMAFMSLGVAMAFLFERPWWQRLVMVGMTVPIALLVNIGRVTILGLLYPIDKDLASGDFHTLVGLLMLIPAGLLFMGLGWVMDQLVVYDETTPPNQPEATDRTVQDAADVASTNGPHLPRVWAGAAAGVALMLVIGVAYAMLVVWSRPDMLPERLSQTLALGTGVATAVLLAGAAAWIVARAIRSAGGATSVPRGLTLGLAAGILLTSATGLLATVKANKLVIIKHGVPLRQKLYLVPERTQGWEMVGKDEILTSEMEQELGTTDYISRSYRDMTVSLGDDGALARLHVAYYTGTPDTVPHVPDRCYVAGGMQPLNTSSVTLNVGGPGYMRDDDGQHWAMSRLHGDSVRIPRVAIPATRFTFTAGKNDTQASNVIYFFAANGKFLASPEAVRAQGFGLRDKYSYYCKIEVGFYNVSDPDEAVARTSEVLSALLPEIMACLPDWVDVTEGRYPPKQ
jgi:exosortase